MGIPEIIHSLFLLLCSCVGWAIKRTLQDELRPIKKDISEMRHDFSDIKKILLTHVDDPQPHSNFEERLEKKFITRIEFIEALENLKKN